MIINLHISDDFKWLANIENNHVNRALWIKLDSNPDQKPMIVLDDSR